MSYWYLHTDVGVPGFVVCGLGKEREKAETAHKCLSVMQRYARTRCGTAVQQLRCCSEPVGTTFCMALRAVVAMESRSAYNVCDLGKLQHCIAALATSDQV